MRAMCKSRSRRETLNSIHSKDDQVNSVIQSVGTADYSEIFFTGIVYLNKWLQLAVVKKNPMRGIKNILHS